MSTEKVIRWLQLSNLIFLALIGWLVSTYGRPLQRTTTFDAYNQRSPDAVHWHTLQPLLQASVFNERRARYANKTRGLLKDERHRAIAAKLCSMEGVDVIADKELGYTLEAYVPYAYFLHLHDCLRSSIGSPGTESFFVFTSEHKTFDKPLRADAAWNFRDFIKTSNPFALVHRKCQQIGEELHHNTFWNPMRHDIDVPYGLTWPSFSAFYHSDAFTSLTKPIAVVAGKYTSEWGSAEPINYIATTDRLGPILDTLLKSGYLVIYNRPSVFFPGDSTSQKIISGPDFNLIRHRYWKKDVILLQDIEAALLPPNLGLAARTSAMNSLMLQIYASTSLFISTQGGNAVIASMFPADNFLLHTRGYEAFGADPAMPSLSGRACIPDRVTLCCVFS